MAMDNCLPQDDGLEAHDDPECLIAWLSETFSRLADEGSRIVDDYWRELRVLENHQPFYRRATLGLRLRLRDNGSFSLEWYGMGSLGKDRRPIARVHIAKSRTQTVYSLKSLMRRQPAWLSDLVESTESELGEIRLKQMRLIRIRDALGDYLRIEGGRNVTGGRLIEAFRLGGTLELPASETLN